MDPTRPAPPGAHPDGAPPDGARPLAELVPLPLPGPAPDGAALDAYLAMLDVPDAEPPLLCLRVYADGRLTVSYADRGVTYRKPVSVEALRQAAAQIPADSGWLAAGLLRWGETAAGP